MSSDGNEEFYRQLRLQELYGKKEAEGESDPLTYTDSTDGTEYEWDRDKKAWFPKVRGESGAGPELPDVT